MSRGLTSWWEFSKQWLRNDNLNVNDNVDLNDRSAEGRLPKQEP